MRRPLASHRGRIASVAVRRPISYGSACAALAATVMAAGPARASVPETSCFNASQANADYEAYGPTDVNAQAGDGHLTVNENSTGTLTVFKYPNPSYYNQLKYFAVGRNQRGQVLVQYPNDGSFAGLTYETGHHTHFTWLRQWHSTQSY